MEALREGKYSLELVPVKLSKALSEVLFTFSDRAERKGVTFTVQEFADLAVIAEEVSLIHDVLNNIVSNAIKFSELGDNITVSFRVKDNKVHLFIDMGVGMPLEILDSLFSNGAPTSRRGTDNEEGTGFGMPLAKNFMDRFGGEIKVRSVEKRDGVPDHGTTFELIFDKNLKLCASPGTTDCKI